MSTLPCTGPEWSLRRAIRAPIAGLRRPRRRAKLGGTLAIVIPSAFPGRPLRQAVEPGSPPLLVGDVLRIEATEIPKDQCFNFTPRQELRFAWNSSANNRAD